VRAGRSYAPQVGYRGQLDNLVRQRDRGRSVRHTRTVVVFDDGLVVCPVPVYDWAAGPRGGIVGSVFRGGRGATSGAASSAGGRSQPGPDGPARIRTSAQALGADAAAADFGRTWPHAQVIPFGAIERIVLTRPRQVSELAIIERTADPARSARSVYLGDLSADGVRNLLAGLLGDRLEVSVPGA
jgi:hypothetical protein